MAIKPLDKERISNINKARLFENLGFLSLEFLLIAAPLVIAIFYGYQHMGENLAYRYFGVARLADGNYSDIWFPQGHITSLIHSVVYYAIENFGGLNSNEYSLKFNLFGYSSNLVVIIIFLVLLAFIYFRGILFLSDKLLILLLTALILYGFGRAGFDYALVPDYYQLNQLLIILMLSIFIALYRADQISLTKKISIFIGIYLGIAVANKVTMLPLALISISPIIFHINFSEKKKLFINLLIIGLSLISTAMLILTSLYQGNIGEALLSIRKIFMFATNQWSEPNFYLLVRGYLIQFKYGVVFLLYIFLCIILLTLIINKKVHSRKDLICVLILVAYGFFSIYTIFRRGTGTTFYEVAITLSMMSAAILVILSGYKKIYWITISILSLTITSNLVYSNVLNNYVEGVKSERKDQLLGWEFFNQLQSRHSKLTVIVPNNDYAFGPFEVFIKGYSNFPSWNIEYGQRYLNNFDSPITFRSFQSNLTPLQGYSRDNVIVWFDVEGKTPMSEAYPIFKNLQSERKCTRSFIVSGLSAVVCEKI